MKWNVTLEYKGGAFLSKRETNDLYKRCMQDVGVHWHQHFRPYHFTQAAWTRYRYTPRSKKYWAMKTRRGIALPLVFTGQSRELAKLAAIRTTIPRGSVAQVRVSMPARALNFRPRSRSGRVPDMADELRQINAQENQALEGVLARSLRRELRSSRNRVRVVVGR